MRTLVITKLIKMGDVSSYWMSDRASNHSLFQVIIMHRGDASSTVSVKWGKASHSWSVHGCMDRYVGPLLIARSITKPSIVLKYSHHNAYSPFPLSSQSMCLLFVFYKNSLFVIVQYLLYVSTSVRRNDVVLQFYDLSEMCAMPPCTLTVTQRQLQL